MNKDAIRKHHDLKSWPEHFAPLMARTKNFEIRYNDRDFQAGDSVTLQEYLPDEGRYTGNALSGIIGYIDDFEQKEGYVVFSLTMSGMCIV